MVITSLLLLMRSSSKLFDVRKAASSLVVGLTRYFVSNIIGFAVYEFDMVHGCNISVEEVNPCYFWVTSRVKLQNARDPIGHQLPKVQWWVALAWP